MNGQFRNLTEMDRFYLAEAVRVRRSSDDPKAKFITQSAVGSVIVGRSGKISESANVLPPLLKDGLHSRGQGVNDQNRYFVIEHAERAAIFKALISGKNTKGATIYCTRFPCSDCARAIVWAEIKRAVFPMGFVGEKKWIESQRAALGILRSSGVTIRYLIPAYD